MLNISPVGFSAKFETKKVCGEVVGSARRKVKKLEPTKANQTRALLPKQGASNEKIEILIKKLMDSVFSAFCVGSTSPMYISECCCNATFTDYTSPPGYSTVVP